MTKTKIRTRFAPSPTGFLHIGGLRSALFAYLFAKSKRGDLILRIEDTDRERYVEGGIENILHSLYWAGVKPDEGIVLAKNGKITERGENGPYIQSQKLGTYKEYINRLIKNGHCYYCFCTKERLNELRQYQSSVGQALGYDGRCRELPLNETKERVKKGESYVVRMKMPRDGSTRFTDLIRGKIEFQNNLVDDQILLKADGFPTYHLAVVVDDYLMGITHVIRGEEWLPSTPKYIQLYKMFNWPLPQFAHLPLLVNDKKQKLSKRHGDVSVRDYIDKGYLPEALINFIAFLGWNPGDEREVFTLKELIKEFKLENVSKAAAVFNIEKLDWYNGVYIRAMNLAELTEKCLPFLINANLIPAKKSAGREEKEWLEKVIALEKDRITKLADLPEAVEFIFADPLIYDSDLLIWKKSERNIIKSNLMNLEKLLNTFCIQDWKQTYIERRIGEWIRAQQLTNGEVLWPMRVALSGRKNSPGPFAIAEVLGKEKTLKRIAEAIESL